LTIGLILLIFSMTSAPRHGRLAPETWAAGLLGLAAMILVEPGDHLPSQDGSRGLFIYFSASACGQVGVLGAIPLDPCSMHPLYAIHSRRHRARQVRTGASMTTVTIFGAGNMGTAIDEVLTAGGATVDHIRSADRPGPVTGEIVVLAVPHPALDDILDKYGDQLAGKIVVDITNPLSFETFDSLVVAPDSSKAAELAAALPSSRVIKAFNTTLAATLNQKQVGPVATTVLVAGDDADAKSALISAVKAGGLDAIDAGPMPRARELEAMGFLQILLMVAGELPNTGGFAVVR
jgi:8-hydroxy-5-deazaflavin:NADPH oxidoreductase